MVQPSLNKAAKRHLRDAEYLDRAGFSANADHLSGFAAECAIKALVVDHLGGRVRGGFPYTDGDVKLDKHIGTWLWNTVALLASGSPEPEVVELFQGTNPFADWNVGDRYAAGTHLTRASVDAHMDGARRAIIALEAAGLSMNGSTPNEV